MPNENRIGLVPVETVEKYEITTTQAAEHLQKRLNTLTSAARKNGVDIEDIQVTLVSVAFSKKFVPFMLILPEEAIHERRKNDKEEIMGIFMNEETRDASKIEDCVWAGIKPYLYTKGDKKSFYDSSNLRKTLGLTSADVNTITKTCSPRIIKTDDRTKHVVCLIDPIRLFSDIIKRSGETDKNGIPKYLTNIKEVKSINHETYKYFVTKEPKKHKKGTSPDIIKIVRTSMTKK